MLGTNNEYGGLEKRIVTGNVCVIANLFFITKTCFPNSEKSQLL